MLYVVNVEACIHQENYGFFFYEPTAKKKLELFDARWNVLSLAETFSEIAAHINRREFKDPDYQVVVCVRRCLEKYGSDAGESGSFGTQIRWHDTTLYAKVLTARALERSGAASVLTSSYTRKIEVVFQAEQEFFASAPQISEWEEELTGITCFLNQLQSSCEAQSADEAQKTSGNRIFTDSFGIPVDLSPKEWEETVFDAVQCEQKDGDSEEEWLRKRFLLVMEEEKLLKDRLEKQTTDEELLEMPSFAQEDEREKQKPGEYITHRIRSLIDGSKINRVCEVFYWPIAGKSSQASTAAMFGLTRLLCTQTQITKENVKEYRTQGDPQGTKRMQKMLSRTLSGYRFQLGEKRRQILQMMRAEQSSDRIKTGPKEENTAPGVPSVPQEYLEHIERVSGQLDACRLFLQEGKSGEMKERVEQTALVLLEASDGLEEELKSYQKTAAEALYTEVGESVCIGFENGTDEGHFLWHKTKKKDEKKTEAAAKEMIRKWQQDMHFLVSCTRFTGIGASFFYLCGCTAAVSGLYFLVHHPKQVQSVYAGLCGLALLAVLMAAGSFRIAGYFSGQIRKSFAQLQKKMEAVLEEYRVRAQDYEDCLNDWLVRLNRQQSESEEKRKDTDQSRQTSMRAWHLANMKRILDLVESFDMEENEDLMQKEDDLLIAARLAQPMDYRLKEIGNEIYWPVWTEEGGKKR